MRKLPNGKYMADEDPPWADKLTRAFYILMLISMVLLMSFFFVEEINNEGFAEFWMKLVDFDISSWGKMLGLLNAILLTPLILKLLRNSKLSADDG